MKITVVASVLLLLVGTVLGLTGCDDTEEITLEAGHSVAEGHPYHLGLEEFADTVNEETGGEVDISIYPDAQLGSERDMIEGLQIGSVDIVVTSTGPVDAFVPEMGVVDLPFLFEDEDHVDRVLEGEIGEDLLAEFECTDIIGLAFWENGFRQLTNSDRPIEEPSDLEGLTLRTMENEVHQASFEELGADPTAMEWGEVFTSLQQGVIDGQENPIPIIYNENLYEVQDYLSLTGHFYSPALLLIGEETMEEIPEEHHAVIEEAAVEAAEYQKAQVREQEAEQIDELEELGMEINEPDQQAFLDATESVYEEFEDDFGADLIEEILNH